MENLKRLLKRRNLFRIHNELEEILAAARQAKMRPREVLEYALGLEVERWEIRRVELGMTLAHFPRYCTLEGFDFSVVPALDEGQIRDLAQLVRQRTCCSLANRAWARPIWLLHSAERPWKRDSQRPSFRPLHWTDNCRMLWNPETFEQKLLQYTKPKLLIIDELGYQPMNAGVTQLMFQLISTVKHPPGGGVLYAVVQQISTCVSG